MCDVAEIIYDSSHIYSQRHQQILLLFVISHIFSSLSRENLIFFTNNLVLKYYY